MTLSAVSIRVNLWANMMFWNSDDTDASSTNRTDFSNLTK